MLAVVLLSVFAVGPLAPVPTQCVSHLCMAYELMRLFYHNAQALMHTIYLDLEGDFGCSVRSLDL